MALMARPHQEKLNSDGSHQERNNGSDDHLEGTVALLAVYQKGTMAPDGTTTQNM